VQASSDAFTFRFDQPTSANDESLLRGTASRISGLDAPQGQAELLSADSELRREQVRAGPGSWRASRTPSCGHEVRRLDYMHTFSPCAVAGVACGFRAHQPGDGAVGLWAERGELHSGFSGINISQFTSGIPNININELTGLSGGPAFLPVNPESRPTTSSPDNLFYIAGEHTLQASGTIW
jgi:hypothetical protein